MDTHKSKESLLRTFMWITIMVGIILGVGYFSFTVVSDKGPPGWDYRPVKSLPSESPYAVYPKNPLGQHVSGKENGKVSGKDSGKNSDKNSDSNKEGK